MANIVIADDKGSNRQFLATLFGYFGHEVLEAEDGAEALALVAAHHPDLLFTDVLMPVMDGLELTRRIRGDPELAATPIIYYSATYRGNSFKALAADLGVAAVIAKPSEPQAILNAVGRVLGEPPSLLSTDPATRFKAAPQNRMTEEFFTSVEDLGATVLRLNATIELGIDLTRERDPARLVEVFCRGAQDIIGAKYAACAMTARDSHEIEYLHTCGLPAETADLLRDAARRGVLFQWMTKTRSVDRRRSLAGDLQRVGLPETHPPIDSFLGIPIHGSTGDPGWLYLAEKFGGDQFTDEDERLASTLAWQAGVAYQNAYLHGDNARKAIELRNSEDQLKRAQRLAKVGSDVRNLRTGERQWSDETYRIFGVRRETFAATRDDVFAMIHPEDQPLVMAGRAKTAAGTAPEPFEYRIVRPDGEVRHVYREWELIRDDAGNPVQLLGTVQDITDRRHTEQQLRLAQKMEALGTLAGGMAHDINNCLVPVLSLTDLLLETVPAGSAQRNCIELIRDAGGRIRDLVRRILIFSRHDAVVRTPFDLRAVLAESIKLLRATLPATIDLRSRVELDEAIVEGDSGQIGQILLNLCVNAADAIGDRSGTIELSLDSVELGKPLDAMGGQIAPGSYFRLQATDTGCGMDEATIAHIFEPFYTTKAPGKGTGLGLAMVHTIVNAHSGHLRVSSCLGAGTTLGIYLPAGDCPAKEG
jgi:PAS domain S-box-containing protein